MVQYPRIPGHEISATVEALGEGVDDLDIGEPVTIIPYTSCGTCPSCRRGRTNACRDNQTLGVQREGAMTEFMSVPREKVLAVGGLSTTALALIEPLTVGFHAVARGEVQADDKVLISGCGMIGLGAVIGASARGAKVAAVDITSEKLDTALAIGAQAGFLSGTSDFQEKVSEWSGGDMADVVIEASGNPNSYRSALESVAFSGRVCCIGYAMKDVPLTTKLIVQKELDLRGSRNALRSDFEAVIQYLKDRKDFPIELIVSQEVNLAGAPDALSEWSANPEKITKLVVNLS